MAEIQDLSVTDDSNIARWPENMNFSEVNDAGRADEGLLARWYRDMDTSITASGSSNAFAITSNRTIASLFNNLVIAWTANHSITDTATLNLNGLGAKTIKRFNGDPLASGDIISGQPVVVVYKTSGDQWFMVSAPAALTDNTFVDLNENAAPGTPSANVARLYAFDDSGTTRLALVDNSAAVTIFLPTASAAEMEAATADRLVPADLLVRHPNVPKAWGKTDQSGVQALDASAGMSSVTDDGTGKSTFTLSTAMSSANYGAFSMCEATSSGSNARQWMAFPASSPTVTTIPLVSAHNGSNAVDSPYVTCLAIGDQ